MPVLFDCMIKLSIFAPFYLNAAPPHTALALPCCTPSSPMSWSTSQGVSEYPTCKFWIFSAPHPSLYTPRVLHMNFQVPSYLPSIRPGYSLFSLKIQRILRIFWSYAVYFILFGINSFNCVLNDRICFPHVQTICLTPKKTTFELLVIWPFWQKWPPF